MAGHGCHNNFTDYIINIQPASQFAHTHIHNALGINAVRMKIRGKHCYAKLMNMGIH